MTNDKSLHQYMVKTNERFAIWVNKYALDTETVVFRPHWHEQIELLYIKKGTLHLICNKTLIEACENSIVVINPNDIHSGVNKGKDYVEYCFIFDISLVSSSFMDICQSEYISPIFHNMIYFNNLIKEDVRLMECLDNIISEYEQKLPGFELAIKSHIFNVLIILYRDYMNKSMPTLQEFKSQKKMAESLQKVFKYIDENYTEKISIKQIAAIASFTPYYFCKIFKEVAGKTFIDYLNYYRVEKSDSALKNTNKSITEIALECGFNNVNYYSRIYKKFRGHSPTSIRRKV